MPNLSRRGTSRQAGNQSEPTMTYRELTAASAGVSSPAVRVTLHPKDEGAGAIIGLLRRSLGGPAQAEGSAIWVDEPVEVVRALSGIDPDWRNHLFCRVDHRGATPRRPD